MPIVERGHEVQERRKNRGERKEVMRWGVGGGTKVRVRGGAERRKRENGTEGEREGDGERGKEEGSRGGERRGGRRFPRDGSWSHLAGRQNQAVFLELIISCLSAPQQIGLFVLGIPAPK